ncbi:MAG: glycerol-3-phosphate acyltransferase [Gudongella sp.]|nr:glycerol-3-phosphate acyltransferase [Gudongella sp.]
MNFLFMILIGYVFGCLQFSYFIGLIFAKTDIRTLGHGNAGASNAFQSLGWRFGVVVGILDILKAIAAIVLAKMLFPQMALENSPLVAYITGAAVIIGHNYPFYMKFKGGKGTASNVGLLFALDWRLGLITVLIVLAVTLITDYISIGTMSMLAVMLLYNLIMKLSPLCNLIALGLALQSFIKHIPNFKRISKKEENGLRKALKKNRA